MLAMATDAITLSVDVRTALGKKNRALRRQGITPVHMYGLNEDSESLQANGRELLTVLRAAGRTTPVTLKVSGGTETVTIVREIARHAVSGDIQHVDFQRVDIQQEVETPVPVSLTGQEDAPGTSGGAGVVTQGAFEILVRAKPFDVPNDIVVDCSGLVEIDSAIMAGEIKLPAGVTLAGPADDRIAWIQPPRVSADDDAAADAAAEGEEGEDSEDAADGDSEEAGDGEEE
jgi:large subunit ribosomal protein L25|tara:strand:+ start:497 stop:1189 length:693 start_codon:yes stop_codon:yes gene_type:complete